MAEVEITDPEPVVGLPARVVGVAFLNRDGVIVAVNGEWSACIGDSDGNLDLGYAIGDAFLDTCDRLSDGRSPMATAIRSALAEDLESTAIVEVPFRPPDHSRWCDITVSTRTSETGERIGVTLMVRRTARAANGVAESGLEPLSDLGLSEAWAMVESSPDGMVLADEQGVIALVNSQVETMFGFDRGELLGRRVEELLPERHRQVHTAHRTRYRVQPRVRAMGSELDLYGRRRDGSEFPVEVSLSPLTTPQGLRVIATVRDVSDKVAAQAHSHAVLHQIDAAHDGVLMFDPDTLDFLYVNRGAQAQLGYSSDELLTMSPIHIKPEFTETSFRAILAPLLDGVAESHVFTTIHRRKDGADLPVEIRLEYPPAARPGEPRMFVALVRDITDRLEAEDARRNSEAAVRLLEDRERLARDLHDLVIQRLFAAGMGLQAVQTQVNDEVAAQRVADTVVQLDETIADLRNAIFELTAPSTKSRYEEITEIIDQSASRMGATPSFSVDGDPELIPSAVVEQLLSTLVEALSNVARHAQAASVDVALVVGADALSLTVHDDGKGLDPKSLRGTGLGNIESRAQQLGGTSTLTSDRGDGTTLTWTAHM